MTVWSRVRLWLRATLWRSRMESEMDAELRFHVEAYAEDLIHSGVPCEDFSAGSSIGRTRSWLPRMTTIMSARR